MFWSLLIQRFLKFAFCPTTLSTQPTWIYAHSFTDDAISSSSLTDFDCPFLRFCFPSEKQTPIGLEFAIMDGRRRPKRDDWKRSQKKKSSRFCWQPVVPSWEKEFCKVVGSLDWDTLLQMKKFTHLYDNVINWNDSAGEEAFFNAKKRFWATKNGLPCDISLPDPDAYIDRIDWDINIGPEPLPDLDVVPNEVENRDPVIIFGDAFIANQSFSSSGWGDIEENINVPANY